MVDKYENITQPLVSIIVITYNSSKFVLETLESAKAQTYQNIELIISDDCSIDNTVEICNKWLKQNNEYFIASKLISVKENTGIPSNINRGLEVAKGEWIKLIAGDDALFDYSISEYIKHINDNPEIEFLYGHYQTYIDSINDKNKQPIEPNLFKRFIKTSVRPKEQFEILLRINPIIAPTTFIKKDIFDRIGVFNEKYKYWEDRPMWMKITQNNIKLHFFDSVVAKYRLHNDSIQQKRNGKLFTDFHIAKESYLKDYYKFFKPYERFLKSIECQRILLIERLGLNKFNITSRIINKITGYFLVKEIDRINNKYL